MKRFYTDVAVVAVAGGWTITLDGRTVKTPRKAPLIVPNPAVAQMIADEWAAQGADIRPSEMVVTGLANAAIDVIGPDPAPVRDDLSRYAETDALAYRGEDAGLLARQVAEWNPLLDWAERRWGVTFRLAAGVMHVDQPAATVAALRSAVAALGAWQLAGLSPLVTMGGSLVVALGMLEGAMTAAAGYAAVTLEERYQEELWGADSDAVKTRARREREWLAAAGYLAALSRPATDCSFGR